MHDIAYRVQSSFGLGGRERGVPEISCWNLDLYENETCDSIHD